MTAPGTGGPPGVLSVGIIGTGGIARYHARACQALEDVALRVACDVSREAVERFGEEFAVPGRYVDLDEMLAAEALDVAIISTWGVLHAETGVRLARSGRVRAILCEKPFTATAAAAEELVAVARQHGVLIAEAFKFRHHPGHLELKARVDAGVIGDLVTVRSAFCQSGDPAARRPERNWRWNRAQGGGSIYDLACYGIHHARYIFGAEPARVFVTAQREGEIDISAGLQLVFPGDRVALLSVGHNVWRSHSAEVAGTSGLLRLENPWNNENLPVTLEQHGATGTTVTEFPARFQFTDQLRHLVECLRTGQPHRIPPEDSVAQMRVLDAVFESIRSGDAVDVSGS